MSQSSNRLSTLAIGFDRAAGDKTLPRYERLRFAKEANWLRMLARLSATERQTIALHVIEQRIASFRIDLLLSHYNSGRREAA